MTATGCKRVKFLCLDDRKKIISECEKGSGALKYRVELKYRSVQSAVFWSEC